MSREDIMMWSLILGMANFVLTWGVALYIYMTNKNKATNARIDILSGDFLKSITDHGTRLVKIESNPYPDISPLSKSILNHSERLSALESRPTHKDLSDMRDKTSELARDVSELTGVVSGMSRLLSDIDKHLRNQPRSQT